jgi:uncharacterized protein with NRDE domain
MCIILFANGSHPRFPLIVAANRDEAYDRPASAAQFWKDHPLIFAGRDLSHGGTWLGLTSEGRFAAITNYRQAQRMRPAPRSRGELTLGYLSGSQDVASYLQQATARNTEYNGYSLIAGTPDRLYVLSNRASGVSPIPAGVHGLSNGLLNDPWPKVQQGVAVLRSLLDADEAQLTPTLFDLLTDSTPAPDDLLPSSGVALERERSRSAIFIPGETYGTRASTVVLVGIDGSVLFTERRFGPRGALVGTTEHRFQLTRTFSLHPAAT